MEDNDHDLDKAMESWNKENSWEEGASSAPRSIPVPPSKPTSSTPLIDHGDSKKDKETDKPSVSPRSLFDFKNYFGGK